MENTEIYYFTGTGNSYVVARDIAESINAKLISIASLSNQESIKINSDVIGIVFPIYYGSNNIHIPLIVERFISKLKNIESSYIFSVCTFGGGIDRTPDKINKLLKEKGGKLSAGFGVHMPQNAFKKPFDNRLKKYKEWNAKKQKIGEIIKLKKTVAFEKNSLGFNIIKRIFALFINLPRAGKRYTALCANMSEDLSFKELMLHTDNSFSLSDDCNGCGICKKICPADNIMMIENKPTWQNHCENCLACYNWCPQQAIKGGIAKDYHYTNPDVKVSDLIKLNETISKVFNF